MNLSEKTVLITGGSSGIGLELARRFLDMGNVVIILGVMMRSSTLLGMSYRACMQFAVTWGVRKK